MLATTYRFDDTVASKEVPMSDELLRRLRESGL